MESEESIRPDGTDVEKLANLETVLRATAEELEQQKRLNQSLLKRVVREPSNYILVYIDVLHIIIIFIQNFKESRLIASKQRPRHSCIHKQQT